MVIIVFPVIDIKKVKSLEDLICDFLVAGQQEVIGIDPCSIFIEISCTYRGISLNDIVFGTG